MSVVSDLPIDGIAAGVTGVLVAGAAVRAFLKGWLDAKAQTSNVSANAAAMVSAVAMGWDKEERVLALAQLGRIAAASEIIAAAQKALADEQKQDMEDKLDKLVALADEARAKKLQARRPPRRRAKAA